MSQNSDEQIPLFAYIAARGLRSTATQSVYARFGLIRLAIRRADGEFDYVLTHALGDEHANKILSGEIPAQEAEKQALRDAGYLHSMKRATPSFSLS